MLAETYGEFFTNLWNTELWSWHSIASLLILTVLVFVVFPR
jgi:hypothetical protein